jgi:hypothetical protein
MQKLFVGNNQTFNIPKNSDILKIISWNVEDFIKIDNILTN